MLKDVQTKQPEHSALVCTKEAFKEANLPKRIQQIKFCVMSPAEIERAGVLHVYQRALYTVPERKPQRDGVLDPRLGISSKAATCETCGQKLAECVGHFGYIHLELPVFHIGYFKNTIQILQCICKSCSRVLLTQDERRKQLKKLRRGTLERLQRAATFKQINDRCKRQKICPHCGEFNGTVKKTSGQLKITHERYKNAALQERYLAQFGDAAHFNEQLEPHLKKMQDDLNPLRALQLFRAVGPDDCLLLDLSGRPEDLLMSVVPVPPVTIRPSVEMDSVGSNEDDITMKLMQIAECNNQLRQGMDKGLPIGTLVESWDFLQVQCALLINSDLPGLSLPGLQQPGRPSRGFVQRLKGKQGRFRGNLSGKRVDFSGRTVISPDPNVRVDEVCVPVHVATTLTFPERVTDHNLDKLRNCIINGTSIWPGANFVCFPDGGKWFLKYGDRRRIANDLKVGDVVERHLEDGDTVLFNRQPSLHRMSIMAHRARIMPWRTLRFNECVCNPYNADFDGDEMNLHVPQTEEARAEAQMLMGVIHNLCTPKNGEILVAATQDFLTTSFLLTSKDVFYTRAEMGALAAYMGDAMDQVDLPPPALLKPLELWTGKQVFSLMVRPNAATRVFVNLETSEKIYAGKGIEFMCPNDGYVAFRNSELLCGRLGKATLGNGNKSGLYQTLATDFSPQAAAACMNRLAKLSARYIGERGFSIGIDDVTPAPHLVAKKQQTVDNGYNQCQDLISAYNKGVLTLQPGCNAEQSLEALVTGVLNKIREDAAAVCMNTLHWHNSPLIMSRCGSKGSPINIAQMVACVGQQSVGGKRCPNGFQDRTLPHFPRGDRTPEGKGFVANSFYSGLAPTEFLFHTMAGREGLVDTAVKTAETGYMSRRLMKALEDLYCHYDSTVRNAASGIVQFEYGGDGLDPVVMEGKNGEAIDFKRLLAVIKATMPRCRQGPGSTPLQVFALPSELRTAIVERFSSGPWPQDTSSSSSSSEALQQGQGRSWCSALFRDSLHKFLEDQVTALEEARERHGLPPGERGQRAEEMSAAASSITLAELGRFVEACEARYDSKRIDLGSTVGAVGAQSIGEPGTQMTLKTFHFAGVASMNVTLGVPRIKEIINASKNISTPIMEVALDPSHGFNLKEANARVVKARIERTTLGEVARAIQICFNNTMAYVHIELDLNLVDRLALDLDARSVRQRILHHPRCKLKEEHVRVRDGVTLEVISPRELVPGELMFSLQALLAMLPRVIVQGIPTVERAVIKRVKQEGGGGDAFQLLVEGTNLQAAMGTTGVYGYRSKTNHVMEVERYLGIEAARTQIISEIKATMGAHGMSIDDRHTMLLADCMTYKGEVLGITRNGIAKMKDSVLMLASFEKTTDHLFDAALHGRTDDINGVSESIIMGITMPTGTGLFKIRQQDCAVKQPQHRPPPVFAY